MFETLGKFIYTLSIRYIVVTFCLGTIFFDFVFGLPILLQVLFYFLDKHKRLIVYTLNEQNIFITGCFFFNDYVKSHSNEIFYDQYHMRYPNKTFGIKKEDGPCIFTSFEIFSYGSTNMIIMFGNPNFVVPIYTEALYKIDKLSFVIDRLLLAENTVEPQIVFKI